MVYQRYVIATGSGENLHGSFQRVQRLWDNEDGTAMFKVEADDPQWANLNVMEGITVLPSLNAPADRHGAAVKQYFTDHGITVDPGDTTLNMLRKLRNAKGLNSLLIDHPF